MSARSPMARLLQLVQTPDVIRGFAFSGSWLAGLGRRGQDPL